VKLRRPYWMCKGTWPVCLLDIVTFCKVPAICRWHDRLITQAFLDEEQE
jgi:hypothetical protein